MEKGWVKLHRRILENHVLMHDDNAFMVFMKLLMIVGQEKGQWSGGRNQLGELMFMNPRTLYGVLQRLQNNGMIHIETNGRYSVISVVNWHKYQNKPNGGQQRSSTLRNGVSSTLGKQGSFEDLSTEENGDAQQELNRSSTGAQHSIKNKKENKKITTNVVTDKPNRSNGEINDLFAYWESTIGYPIESLMQKNRYAVNNLLKKHGKAGVEKLIQGVAMAKGDRYGPDISDFIELQSKKNKLLSWGHRQSKSPTGVIKL